MKTIPTILVLLIFANNSLFGQGQLIAKYSSSRLPHPSFTHSIWYDGVESIYIFGGGPLVGDNRNEIHKYSIQTDQITKVGKLPGDNGIFEYGWTTGDNSGNIFIFGGRSSPTDGNNDIIKFTPSTNKSEIVAHYYDTAMRIGPVIKQNSASNKLLLFGELNNITIKEFETETSEIRELAPLPNYFHEGAAIVAINDSRAYIFNNFYGFNPKVKEMDLDTLEIRDMWNTNMPASSDPTPVGMWDGKNIYLVSSYYDDGAQQEGILKFDPISATFTFLAVLNWPVENGNDTFYVSPKCTYVSNLDRMYCFGGYTMLRQEIDDIYYVDLDPLSG